MVVSGLGELAAHCRSLRRCLIGVSPVERLPEMPSGCREIGAQTRGNVPERPTEMVRKWPDSPPEIFLDSKSASLSFSTPPKTSSRTKAPKNLFLPFGLSSAPPHSPRLLSSPSSAVLPAGSLRTAHAVLHKHGSPPYHASSALFSLQSRPPAALARRVSWSLLPWCWPHLCATCFLPIHRGVRAALSGWGSADRVSRRVPVYQRRRGSEGAGRRIGSRRLRGKNREACCHRRNIVVSAPPEFGRRAGGHSDVET
ncbi:hypothetical protein K438DRAFT_842597 [Mycena galopus ATCC 62051]|nr:hypothetical protein K438DRAFT_842597 [Mycena galopus ATCC 62051]